jgi:diadenosine tetraphosphatase ApaH/serine/threonine PP2A family protein phosphatase
VHREFFESLPLTFEADRYFFCHAGVPTGSAARSPTRRRSPRDPRAVPFLEGGLRKDRRSRPHRRRAAATPTQSG